MKLKRRDVLRATLILGAVTGALAALAQRLRAMPVPILGRINEGALWLDCRCLLPADEARLVSQMSEQRMTE